MKVSMTDVDSYRKPIDPILVLFNSTLDIWKEFDWPNNFFPEGKIGKYCKVVDQTLRRYRLDQHLLTSPAEREGRVCELCSADKMLYWRVDEFKAIERLSPYWIGVIEAVTEPPWWERDDRVGKTKFEEVYRVFVDESLEFYREEDTLLFVCKPCTDELENARLLYIRSLPQNPYWGRDKPQPKMALEEFVCFTPAWVRRSTTPYTYFVQSGDCGPIKIGKTVHVLKRMRAIGTDNAESLKLVGVIGRDVESQLHVVFEHLCVRGEWFGPAPELVDFIIENRDPEVQEMHMMLGVRSLKDLPLPQVFADV